jgi:hypothetical protein
MAGNVYLADSCFISILHEDQRRCIHLHHFLFHRYWPFPFQVITINHLYCIAYTSRYGFTKTRSDPEWREFINPLFLRDKPELVYSMKRKGRPAAAGKEEKEGGEEGYFDDTGT